MIANENIQDQALENFKSEKTEVTIFFLNGFQMKGVVENILRLAMKKSMTIDFFIAIFYSYRE
ncbi:RNA chaperone Hfq, partial [Staphylococcus epidermidis]|uniref:RNA chaperone Hfq n=1 Tax=Staphylococcus epidermidis TaxID=1282 RepID=UPI001E2E1F82